MRRVEGLERSRGLKVLSPVSARAWQGREENLS